jgi:hypothetical protein
MTAALLWKEYRQQRTIWLAIPILAIVLLSIIAVSLSDTSGYRLFQDPKLRTIFTVVVCTLTIAHGLVTGALLLAGELDDGTLTFLDNLTGRRTGVWQRKCIAGILLTLSQSMMLAAVAICLGFGREQLVIALPLLSLSALAWGLLGGAVCSTVVTAVLTAIVGMAAGWLLSIFSISMLMTIGLEAVPAIGAGYASWRVFCRNDLSRQPTRPLVRDKLKTMVPAQWRVMSWLVWRQGRWVLIGGMIGSLVLGFIVNFEPLVLWPVGTLLIGLACGLTAFAPDQFERNKFLGAQRFPPGRYWTAKILLWGGAGAVFTLVAWVIPTVLLGIVSLGWELGGAYESYRSGRLGNPSQWLEIWMGHFYNPRNSSAVALLALWPLYGFCIGQFFGQLARRPVIAVILAAVTAPLLAALWVPSLLIGGLPTWQVLVIPVVLLISTRFTQRPWQAGRVLDRLPLLGIGGAAVFMVLALASCLWYRAVQVPDLGEPFDTKAFLASFPTPKEYQAGPLIRKAARDSMQQFNREYGGWSQFSKYVVPALASGWPAQDEKLGQVLDLMFDGEWVKESSKAAELPLGLVEDPRNVGILEFAYNPRADHEFVPLAQLFAVRALQLHAQGKAADALNHLETALGVSRQLRNFASDSLLGAGVMAERSALAALFIMLEKGLSKEELKDAQALLQRHAAAVPDPVNSTKAAYLVLRNHPQNTIEGRHLGEKLQSIAVLVPWEKERQSRILRAMALVAIRTTEQLDLGKPLNRLRSVRFADVLPPKDGPGSSLNSKQWSDFAEQTGVHGWWWEMERPFGLGAQSLTDVRATELIVALMRYQGDHGSPPQKLQDLVPAYLATLPTEPIIGGDFEYRVAMRLERIPSAINALIPERETDLILMPGQAVLSSRVKENALYPVPLANK